MPKTRTANRKDYWKTIKNKNRAEYNKEYDKDRSDMVDSNGKLKKGTTIEFDVNGKHDHPREVPLDYAVLYMEKGYGDDIKIVFRDDTSEEEIKAILSLVESDINAKQ